MTSARNVIQPDRSAASAVRVADVLSIVSDRKRRNLLIVTVKKLVL